MDKYVRLNVYCLKNTSWMKTKRKRDIILNIIQNDSWFLISARDIQLFLIRNRIVLLCTIVKLISSVRLERDK